MLKVTAASSIILAVAMIIPLSADDNAKVLAGKVQYDLAIGTMMIMLMRVMIVRMQMRIAEGDPGIVAVIFSKEMGAQVRVHAGYLGRDKHQGNGQDDK